jgi:hypothetical protein
MDKHFAPSKQVPEVSPDELFKKDDCPLCRLVPIRPQFLLTVVGANDYILTICNTCEVPMLVYRFHEQHPQAKKQAIDKVVEFFNTIGITVTPRETMRKIKYHWHCHFDIKEAPR